MYFKDQRNGWGVMEWIDGNKYEGQWVDGVQQGFGIMSTDNGKTRAGFFDKNVYIKPLNSVEELQGYDVPEDVKEDMQSYLKMREEKKKQKKKKPKGKKFLEQIDSEQEDLGQTFKSPEVETKEGTLYPEMQSMDYKDNVAKRIEKISEDQLKSI